MQEVVDSHNRYRKAVGVANLVWSDEVAASAQEWANHLGDNCSFSHSNSSYGENIWKGTAGAFAPTDVVDSWGSEETDYSAMDHTCATGAVCGHYTQIVWKNTTKVGCGTTTCDGQEIWVCQYDPAGNVTGQSPF
ncbi:hypothetical protein BFP72_01395 [Reichenbachiella sp. 5M10]|nr:hypothetical protein BFP72_01395 [Reichenbachiella sp. 5M10]